MPLLAAALVLSIPASSPVVRREFVFKEGPFRQCHASTLAESRGGLVAAWFGGDHEKARNVSIYVARSDETGGWTRPVRVASGGGVACWNPVLCQPSSGPLLLFYKVGPRTATWWGMMRTSNDGGKTWSRATRLPEGILGPIKDKPLELPDGTLLCGSSEELGGERVHMERTPDLGRTWSRTPDLNDPTRISAIQPTLLPLGGSRVRALGRTRQGRVFAIDSKDGGRTWGAMRLLDVPNPNSGIDAVRLRDGRYLLVYNDTPDGRSSLDVAISTDAERWRRTMGLEEGPGEYSYPAVIQTADGMVHVTYTWKRKRIRHVVLDPRRL